MGCGSSAQKADVDEGKNHEVKALSLDMKTRFANIDPGVLGPHKEEAKAKLAFMYGKTANIFLIMTPPFHKDHQHHHGDAAPPPPPPEGEEQAAAKEAPPVEETRWTIFNDSKSDATVEATFFHAQTLRAARPHDAAADAEPPSHVKLERFDGGRVKAEVAVPAGATVAFVEGPIKGYMWKCMVHDPKTDRFESATAAE